MSIEVGNDCDDTDPQTNPAGWDGPKGDGQADRCDGIDQNCNGVPDDGKLKDGTSCSCSPADVRACSEDDTGKPVTFPTLDGSGKPVGVCHLGGQTCLADAKWGPCTGIKAPTAEVCDKLDNDCDGEVDEADAANPPMWREADDDLHGSKATAPVKSCDAPKTCPKECLAATPPGDCPKPCSVGPSSWKTEIPADDCNDLANKIHPGATQAICVNEDTDCDGKIPACGCQPGQTQACDQHPGKDGVGPCKAGAQTCVTATDGSTAFGSCLGAVGPTGESGDPSKDLDCDGHGGSSSLIEVVNVFRATSAARRNPRRLDRPPTRRSADSISTRSVWCRYRATGRSPRRRPTSRR